LKNLLPQYWIEIHNEQYMSNLIIDTISDGNKFGQTNIWKLQMALSGIKRKAVPVRIPIISSLMPRSYFGYVGKKVPVNGKVISGKANFMQL